MYHSFGQVYKDASQPVEVRVDDLMRYMTLEDKIGQMTLVDYGPLSKNFSDIVTYRLGNVLYGGDSDPKDNTVDFWA
jgi:beta-glucosidase